LRVKKDEMLIMDSLKRDIVNYWTKYNLYW